MSAAWKRWALPTPGADVDMWEWQNGRCAWCGRKAGSRLVEDHCHLTGLVRGFLCRGCNSSEGWAPVGKWDAWREGDNPAFALKEFSIYFGWGGTALSPNAVLSYYTPAERAAWWQQVLTDLNAGGPWPIEAPWTDEARARHDRRQAETAAAINRVFAKVNEARAARAGESA